MKRIAALVAFLLLMAVSPAGAAGPGYAWHDTNTGTTAHFRGLAAVSATTAWVGGYTPTDGVVMRTTDRGATWQSVGPAIPMVPTGLAYSRFRNAFYTWHFTCDPNGSNAVAFGRRFRR